MPGMRAAVGEIVFRIKVLVVGAALGAVAGFCGWLWWLSQLVGGGEGWSLKTWIIWTWRIYNTQSAAWAWAELMNAAQIGAGVVAVPLAYFFFFRRSNNSNSNILGE